ncbi:MAG: LysR family transcriptional regulator [Pseudomonadota bacterium]
MKIPKSTLEQWQVLQAIVDCGGYAQAAEALHRSQSSVSYMVAKLQEQLGVELLEIDGRRARLTKSGAALLDKARALLDDAFELEDFAHSLNAGWESEVRFSVDSLFPTELLIKILQQFEPLARHTRVNLEETVLSVSDDVLHEKRADIVIAHYVPSGFLGDQLLDVEFVAVAHPDHPLHALGRAVNDDDLNRYLHIVVHDAGTINPRGLGWMGTAHRWTVSTPATRLEMICAGLGFGWMATHKIGAQLASGQLKALPLRVGQTRKMSLSLIIANAERPGPAACQLVSIIRSVIARHCRDHGGGCPEI